jgi:hypothetical protein
LAAIKDAKLTESSLDEPGKLDEPGGPDKLDGPGEPDKLDGPGGPDKERALIRAAASLNSRARRRAAAV